MAGVLILCACGGGGSSSASGSVTPSAGNVSITLVGVPSDVICGSTLSVSAQVAGSTKYGSHLDGGWHRER